MIKDLIRLAVKLTCYFRFELLSRKKANTIIFNSYKNKHFNFNSKYLFLYLRNRGHHCYFIIDDDSERNQLVKKFGSGFISATSYKDLGIIFSSAVWITSTGMPIRIPFASWRRTIINVWHGIPLKKVGVDELNVSLLRWFIIKFIYSNQYTIITAPSQEIGEILSNSLLCDPSTIRLFGQPQNDIQKGLYPQHLMLDRKAFKKRNSGRKILYAPTYRNNTSAKLFPFNDFNPAILGKFNSDHDLSIFIRTHDLDQHTSQLIDNIPGVEFLGSNIIPDIMEVLDYFDLLITDYSSLYFDFLLLERPVLFLPYDKREYEQSRGFYFDYDQVTAGPKPTSQIKFLDEIERLLSDQSYYQLERKAVRDRIHQTDQSSCQSLAEYLEALQR